jgi:hypothetical protein
MGDRAQQRCLQLVRAACDGRLTSGLGAPARTIGQLRGHQRGKQQQGQSERFIGAGHRHGAARVDEQHVVAQDGRDHRRDGRPAPPATRGEHDRHQVQQNRRRQVDDRRLQETHAHQAEAHASQGQAVLDQHPAPRVLPPVRAVHLDA